MEIRHHEFKNVIPKTDVCQAILITGYNLKLVYHHLNESGCEVFPDEAFQYGHIWVYNPKTQTTTSYTPPEFDDLFTDTLRKEKV